MYTEVGSQARAGGAYKQMVGVHFDRAEDGLGSHGKAPSWGRFGLPGVISPVFLVNYYTFFCFDDFDSKNET
jgi:hypothetical protein